MYMTLSLTNIFNVVLLDITCYGSYHGHPGIVSCRTAAVTIRTDVPQDTVLEAPLMQVLSVVILPE